jgi:hypothetical protein
MLWGWAVSIFLTLSSTYLTLVKRFDRMRVMSTATYQVRRAWGAIVVIERTESKEVILSDFASVAQAHDFRDRCESGELRKSDERLMEGWARKPDWYRKDLYRALAHGHGSQPRRAEEEAPPGDHREHRPQRRTVRPHLLTTPSTPLPKGSPHEHSTDTH